MIVGKKFTRSSNGEKVIPVKYTQEDEVAGTVYYVIVEPKLVHKVLKESSDSFFDNYKEFNVLRNKGDKAEVVATFYTEHAFSVGQVVTFKGYDYVDDEELAVFEDSNGLEQMLGEGEYEWI